MDRAHHRGEVVGATGGDLDRAHRAGPHRPAVLQSAVGRRPGAVLVRDHPQRRASLWAADLVAALLDPLQRRDPAELAAAGPAVPATGLGTLLALLLDGLGALARTTSTPRAATVRGVVLASAASGSKSCYPFTENPPAHRAPPAVRAGAGAPAVAGPSGPATLSLLTSSRAARPAPGPPTTATAAATRTTEVAGSRTNLRREGRSAPSPRAPTSGEPPPATEPAAGERWWSGRGLTHDDAPEGCQTARTAASAHQAVNSPLRGTAAGPVARHRGDGSGAGARRLPRGPDARGHRLSKLLLPPGPGVGTERLDRRARGLAAQPSLRPARGPARLRRGPRDGVHGACAPQPPRRCDRRDGRSDQS